jgi:abnormal spindle-like microcephaly-associated protein
MAAVALWQRLVCAPSPGAAARAQALARQPPLLAKLEGVARVLALKLGADQKYLTKLEREKGSDVSARQATRALLATSRMLRALRAVLAATGASSAGGAAGQGEGSGELRLGRNTLVREALREAK